jgi:hypothetical protein
LFSGVFELLGVLKIVYWNICFAERRLAGVWGFRNLALLTCGVSAKLRGESPVGDVDSNWASTLASLWGGLGGCVSVE